MSNPSFSNIDRWLFELMEGNLTPEQQAQLEAFLLQHPELEVDKDMWEFAKVDKEEVVYPNNHKLVRRRPVGLYMSLGFASIVALISIGVYTHSGVADYQFNSEGQLVSVKSNDDGNESSSIQKAGNSIKTSILKASLQANSPKSQAENKSSLNTKPYNSEFSGNQNLIHSTTQNNTFIPELRRVEASNTLVASNASSPLNELTSSIHQNQVISSNSIGADPYSEGNKDVTDLPTEEAKIIESVLVNDQKLVAKEKSSNSRNTFAKTDYKLSFASRMSKMGRSIQRMMDNPVALKNMKDPYYHVPGMQSMDVNFGAAGTLLATRVQSVSRAQWYGEENQQLMNQISVDGYSYGMRGGLGFQLNHNFYGTGGIQNYNAALIYAPKFSVARNVVVEPSFRFKMGNKKLNINQIETGSHVEYDRMNTQQFYDDGTTPVGQTLWYKDLGAGIMVNTKWFFVGVQADNLMGHYDNIYSSDLDNPRRAGKHYVATIGTDYESAKENLSVSPYMVYQKQESLSEGWLGVNFRYHWLTLGGAVSSNFEPAASLGLKFDHFMLTYNADYTQSDLLQSRSLSHQVTIRFLSKPSRVGQRLLNQ